MKRSDHGHVLHYCDYRLCCNPGHFFIGTATDNMLDMYQKGRHPVYRGEAHTNAKLTQLQADEIRALYASTKVRQTDLAARYGVSQRVISNIILGRSY
jgi:hypothetical protein